MPIPQTREGIPMLLKKYQQSSTDEPYLTFSSRVEDYGKMFILGTSYALQLLAERDDWLY